MAVTIPGPEGASHSDSCLSYLLFCCHFMIDPAENLKDEGKAMYINIMKQTYMNSVDYCNAFCVRLPLKTIGKQKLVQNA